MEVKRLYDREYRFVKGIILMIILIILGSVFFIIKSGKDDFKEDILQKDYMSLYGYIQDPDFSNEIFNIYMDYNYGGNIKIIDEKEENGYTYYKIRTEVGEKELKIKKENRKEKWIFDDYVYNWTIKLPAGAHAFLQNSPLENRNGEITISKLPFAVYEVRAEMDNCDKYYARIMAGQKVEINMNVSSEVMEHCRNIIGQYLSFKEDAINSRKVKDTDCVEKDSGIYKEVLDQVEWQKSNDYTVKKNLQSIDVEKGVVEDDGTICVDILEVWNSTVINENGENRTTETFKNSYFIKPEGSFIITRVKSRQV